MGKLRLSDARRSEDDHGFFLVLVETRVACNFQGQLRRGIGSEEMLGAQPHGVTGWGTRSLSRRLLRLFDGNRSRSGDLGNLAFDIHWFPRPHQRDSSQSERRP